MKFMGSSLSLRDKLHQYIDVADEQKLQALYVLPENEMNENYSAEEIAMFHQRRDNHLKGISKSYTPEESLKAVRRQK